MTKSTRSTDHRASAIQYTEAYTSNRKESEEI